MSDLDDRLRELAKDRNDGREPDDLHLAYEAELWRLRREEARLTAEVAELKARVRRARAASFQCGTGWYDR